MTITAPASVQPVAKSPAWQDRPERFVIAAFIAGALFVVATIAVTAGFSHWLNAIPACR